jgi:hypothetical protein
MTGVWICAGLTTFWAVFATLVALFPGFLDYSPHAIFSGHHILNNADLPTGVSRLKYELISFIAIGVTMVAGIIFYWLGAETRANMVTQPLEGNEDLALASGD